jgi:hypothetical protein
MPKTQTRNSQALPPYGKIGIPRPLKPENYTNMVSEKPKFNVFIILLIILFVVVITAILYFAITKKMPGSDTDNSADKSQVSSWS